MSFSENTFLTDFFNFSLTNLESKESLTTNGLDALEPGIHHDEVQDMSKVLDSLTKKCDDLTRRQKEIPSLSHTNQRRLHMLSGKKFVLEALLIFSVRGSFINTVTI